MNDRLNLHEDFLLGNKLLDAQHQKLLKLSQQAYDCALEASDATPQRFNDLLADISNCSQEHFYTEEEFMKKHGYAGIDNHVLKHDEFEDMLTPFLALRSQDKDAIRQMATQLLAWVTNHLREEDAHFRVWERARQEALRGQRAD